MKGTMVSNHWLDYLYIFMVGAFIGWSYEVILHLFQDGVFVNRGMLHGPWLPIYGIGCVLMVTLKQWMGPRPLQYFLICVVVSGVLEYITSWAMEMVYHTRWWDYSSYLFNVNGCIFLGGLLGFGTAGCLFVYVLLPCLEKFYRRFPPQMLKYLAIFMGVIFLVDAGLSTLFPNMGVGITK